MRIIVTRVQPQAQHWVAQLQELGFDALALPLIEVRAVADTSLLKAAWQELRKFAAVMFVSRAAVDFVFKTRERCYQYKILVDRTRHRAGTAEARCHASAT